MSDVADMNEISDAIRAYRESIQLKSLPKVERSPDLDKIDDLIRWGFGDLLNEIEVKFGRDALQEAEKSVPSTISPSEVIVVARNVPLEDRDPAIPWVEYRRRVLGY